MSIRDRSRIPAKHALSMSLEGMALGCSKRVLRLKQRCVRHPRIPRRRYRPNARAGQIYLAPHEHYRAFSNCFLTESTSIIVHDLRWPVRNTRWLAPTPSCWSRREFFWLHTSPKERVRRAIDQGPRTLLPPGTAFARYQPKAGR